MALALAACLHGLRDATCGSVAVQSLRGSRHAADLLELNTTWAEHAAELDSSSTSSLEHSGVCVNNRSVPTFYLLGQQKAGTSTLATDLFVVGIRSGNGTRKELHTFDDHCGFLRAIERTPEEWSGHSQHCKPFSANEAQDWAQNHFDKDCSRYRGEIGDMTPDNLRLPSLPSVLQRLYAGSSAFLKFVIALRDPLFRLHSGYYQYHMEAFPTFASYVNMLLERLPAYHSSGWRNLETDYTLDQFYRSMYSLNIEPWLNVFYARQFVVIPMKPYFESLERRKAILGEIAHQFKIELHPGRLQSTTHVYAKEHATLEEDVSEEDIAALRLGHFDPDAERLARALTAKLGEGLVVAGFSKVSSSSPSANDVLKYIVDNW